MSRPELDELLVADAPEAWSALGFTVVDGVVPIGGVWIRLGAEGEGIAGWTLREQRSPAASVEHPIGAVAIDHVVMFTPEFDRTLDELRAEGLDYRRTRDAGDGLRQAFFVLGPCLLELAGPADGPARLWGVTLVVDDLDAAAERLGDRLGRVKDAVQPGRRIATLRREAGLSVPLALISVSS